MMHIIQLVLFFLQGDIMDPDSKPPNSSIITLDIQQIELLNIVNAKTKDELMFAAHQTYNLIPYDIKRICNNNLPLEHLKQQLILMYKRSMLSYKDNNNDTLINNHIIRHVIQYMHLSKEYRKALKRAFKSSNNETIVIAIKKNMTYKYERTIMTITGFHAVISPSILHMTYGELKQLSEQVRQANLLYVPELTNYTQSTRLDGVTYTQFIKTALDFAKQHAKKLIIGHVVTHTNIPTHINNLKASKKNKAYVNNLLQNHTAAISKYIRDYEDAFKIKIVDTIVVAAEPINTRSINKHHPYALRYDIWKRYWWNRSNNREDTNVSPGWYRFINITDISDCIYAIQQWLPDTKMSIYETDLNIDEKSSVLSTYLGEIETKSKTIVYVISNTPSSKIPILYTIT